MKEGFFVATIIGAIFVAIFALLIWADWATTTSKVTFNEHEAIACVKFKPANTWEYKIDKCLPVK